jgi:hypothetical protein
MNHVTTKVGRQALAWFKPHDLFFFIPISFEILVSFDYNGRQGIGDLAFWGVFCFILLQRV